MLWNLDRTNSYATDVVCQTSRSYRLVRSLHSQSRTDNAVIMQTKWGEEVIAVLFNSSSHHEFANILLWLPRNSRPSISINFDQHRWQCTTDGLRAFATNTECVASRTDMQRSARPRTVHVQGTQAPDTASLTVLTGGSRANYRRWYNMASQHLTRSNHAVYSLVYSITTTPGTTFVSTLARWYCHCHCHCHCIDTYIVDESIIAKKYSKIDMNNPK